MPRYIKRSSHNIKSLAVRQTLYLSLVRSHLAYASQVWAPQSMELIARLERIQTRASKYILDLTFISNTTYSDRHNQLQLLPLTYWHEYLDLIFFFKCVNGIIDLNNEILPNPAQTNKVTRSTTDVSCLVYETKLCNTSTPQNLFISRTIRTLNSLPKQLRSNINSLTSFKSLHFKYHVTVLESNYNVKDSRKTLCLKCNRARDLTEHISCCF